jgi:hypothetical protein
MFRPLSSTDFSLCAFGFRKVRQNPHRLKSVLPELFNSPGEFVASRIEVEKTGELKFRVRVAESGTETTHEVTVNANDYAKLTAGKIEPEELVRKSFEFLLEREPKESILSRFDLSVISRYFPQYEHEMKRRLSNSK